MRYITVEDLSFYYDKEPVLEHINYSVDSGEFVIIEGQILYCDVSHYLISPTKAVKNR